MLKARILTAMVLLAAFLASLFYLPGIFWNVLVLLALGVASREWGVFSRFTPMQSWGFVLSQLLLAFPLIKYGADWIMLPWLLSALFWALLAPLWLGLGWQISNRFWMALSGSIVLLPTFLALHALQARPWLLLALMAVVWLADSAAYFSGRRFGRHKLAPSISPGKTWEGVWGAFLAVALYGTVLFAATDLPAHLFGQGVFGLLFFVSSLCLLTSFSILGDLFESWMKRQVGLKDSGSILPGHGGLLDRIDALTSTLPLAALALTIANEISL